MSARCIIKLSIILDVEGPVMPETLFLAHRVAEDAAGKALARGGATSVITKPGGMSKTDKGPRS